jgi:phosphinothricin acetyltransferase
MDHSILSMLPNHWPAVREIYGQGIATGNATFETELPDWEKWDSRHRKDCRLVAVETGNQQNVRGWAALSPVSSSYVYRGVAEVSVYVGLSARGRGVGKSLLQSLIREAETSGVWTLQAGIFPENTASLTLHKSWGFREVGVREKIGMLKGVWRDVLLLERRSPTVG